MSQARDQILQRLRAGRPADFEVPPSDFSVVRTRDWSDAEKRDLFQRKMESVHTEVHRVRDTDWVPTLLRLLAEKNLPNLWVSEHKAPGQTLKAQWHADLPSLLHDNRPIEEWKVQLFEQVSASLTTCRGAIAETGSLILWPDQHEPRLLSLVPPVHFVLLSAEHIYSTFDEAIRAQQWVSIGLPTNALLISGPSKTADIEQTLAYGVHGPRELIVLLIEADS